MIDVKEAVKIASEQLVELVGPDKISALRLEEVELTDDESCWLITLGFTDMTMQGVMQMLREPARQYRVLAIDAENGHFKSMKMRESSRVA